ncbi:hypothetical protein ASH01_15830 [Terrabacter sp. Soil811]|uniref:PqqD family protein n=1 Tax=Terrabacter sp. Soil811 TaxID=1736419 RepID=UPI0006F852CD|nr:PqqD family peptide modification chaperone [Terrabacter sp. Soil811]KRF43268.1 hypothetical protein ASH01_15830 [Terrabacter sp. Soil811]
MNAAYRPGPDTGVTVSDDGLSVYVARLPGGPLVVLDGAAALIWVEATTGPATGWVSRVADAVGQAEDAIAADVTAFVADLRARELLQPLAQDESARGTEPA